MVKVLFLHKISQLNIDLSFDADFIWFLKGILIDKTSAVDFGIANEDVIVLALDNLEGYLDLIRVLLHEFLHFVFCKLRLPKFFHHLIDRFGVP
ncbi:MAG: hypothetical protein QXT14_02850 [Candidatus Bathyarchaeia archaeon]